MEGWDHVYDPGRKARKKCHSWRGRAYRSLTMTTMAVVQTSEQSVVFANAEIMPPAILALVLRLIDKYPDQFTAELQTLRPCQQQLSWGSEASAPNCHRVLTSLLSTIRRNVWLSLHIMPSSLRGLWAHATRICFACLVLHSDRPLNSCYLPFDGALALALTRDTYFWDNDLHLDYYSSHPNRSYKASYQS